MSTRRYTGPWGTVINSAILGPYVSLGIIGLLVAVSVVAEVGGLGFIADATGLLLAVQALAIVIGLPIMLTVGVYKDAAAIRRSKIKWSPSPILYALGNFFIPFVGLHYIWKRYKFIPEPTHQRVWWYLSVLAFALAVGGMSFPVVGGVVGSASGTSGGALVGVLTGSAVALVAIPVGITFLPILVYMDTRYLHAKAAKDGLVPINPVNYLLGMAFMWFIPPLGMMVAGLFAALVSDALLYSGFLFMLGPFVVFGVYANKRRKIAGLV